MKVVFVLLCKCFMAFELAFLSFQVICQFFLVNNFLFGRHLCKAFLKKTLKMQMQYIFKYSSQWSNAVTNFIRYLIHNVDFKTVPELMPVLS